jgi:hypothetical protein
MSQFITRVELHGAIADDYETLHSAMSRAGFSRTIVGDSGVKSHLPTAEYHVIGNYTLDAVYEAAVNAANSTGKRFWILSTEISGWRGYLVQA